MFSVLVLAVDYKPQNYVYRNKEYSDNCTLVAEDDPHICENEGDPVFCPFAIYLPESGLYQCRTFPGSYLITENTYKNAKLLNTFCPDG